MNTVNVYKIDTHLILTGTGSKLIKEELKDIYEARWQGAPFNMWLIPNTKLKSFMKDKKINSKVSIIASKSPKSIKSPETEIKKSEIKTKKIEKEKRKESEKEIENKTIEKENKKEIEKEKNKTIEKEIEIVKSNIADNLLDILPLDIIQEIVNNMDDQSLTSLLTSTKNLHQLSVKYKEPIQKQALERELKHINRKMRKYYSSELLDLKVNDRVIYDDKNYKILSINGNKGGKMVHVDMLGNIIGKEINYSIIKQERDWGAKKLVSFYWGIPLPNNKSYQYSYTKNLLFLQPGILQYDNGPHITSVNSRYLKYKTVPTTQVNGEPELNMMVKIKIYENGYQDSIREYAITKLEPHHTVLEYVGGNNRNILGDYNFNKKIELTKLIKNKEDLSTVKVMDGKYHYEILKIGGFGW